VDTSFSRRALLRLAGAGLAGCALGVGARRRPVRAQEAGGEPSVQDERSRWSAYARWLNASWTTMAYPERYDCDLPIWYMAMWAKANNIRVDWYWKDYFRQPVVLRFTQEASRDLPMQSWRFETYEEFAQLSQAYFGIKHLPELVARTGGRQLRETAFEIAWGRSQEQLWPGDIISSGDHGMTFIEPYESSSHYLIDYQRPCLLQQRLRRLEERAAYLPAEERAEIQETAMALRLPFAMRLNDLRTMEMWLGYRTPGNPWDPVIQEALAQDKVPSFVPGRIVDSTGADAPKGDWSQIFSGIVYPDLAEQPLPHVASASGRQMWEWFRPVADGEECDWRCSAVVLRPFADGS